MSAKMYNSQSKNTSFFSTNQRRWPSGVEQGNGSVLQC